MKNRLIKFRIWDKQLNHFACEGEYLGSSFGLIEKGFPFYRQAINRDFDSQEDYEKFCEQNFVVQQFTGLLDREGKEIYEGDIVFSSLKSNGALSRIFEVKFEQGAFNVGNPSKLYSLACDYTVKGNIFETPDLL